MDYTGLMLHPFSITASKNDNSWYIRQWPPFFYISPSLSSPLFLSTTSLLLTHSFFLPTVDYHGDPSSHSIPRSHQMSSLVPTLDKHTGCCCPPCPQSPLPAPVLVLASSHCSPPTLFKVPLALSPPTAHVA